MRLPAKTVERLSQYRRVLQKYEDLDELYIFSHDLASMLRLTPVKVRRDLMLLKITGHYRSGYNVKAVLKTINETLSIPKTQKTTIIGMGELGQALLKNISSNPACPALIPATFDLDPNMTNKTYHNVPCYDFIKAPELIKKHDIRIAILTINTPETQEIVDSLILSGIWGFVNFMGGPFRVPEGIYLKDYDIRTTLDELSYFVSQL